MKRGFTLLEILVASLLLSMLVTILTMIFNQSSIAWTTGVASITGLGNTRENISTLGLKADNMLDPQTGLQVLSVWNWDENNSGGDSSKLRTTGRTVDRQGQGLESLRMEDPGRGETTSVAGGNASGKPTYIVGVSSNGPDGIPDTWDDITTLPEED